MPVYVDPLMRCVPNRNWRYTESCHLFADTLPELHDFALNKLGLRSAWFQTGQGVRRVPHYDLTRGNHFKAIKLGAILLDRRATVAKWDELGFTRKRLCR